jgi:hypothetical protein
MKTDEKDILYGFDNWEECARYYKEHWDEAHQEIQQYVRTKNHFKDKYERLLTRKDILEEWLTEYRDELKKENVYHKNQGIINAINELLNENSTRNI